jgi:hypothetical protein
MYHDLSNFVSRVFINVAHFHRKTLLIASGKQTKTCQAILSLSPGKEHLKLSLCLTKHHAMKAYWGSGGIAPLIL